MSKVAYALILDFWSRARLEAPTPASPLTRLWSHNSKLTKTTRRCTATGPQIESELIFSIFECKILTKYYKGEINLFNSNSIKTIITLITIQTYTPINFINFCINWPFRVLS